MATVNSVEQRMAMSYNFSNAEDGIIYQSTVIDFMEFLLNGQLQKDKHTGLMDRFVKWVSQDPHWGLALPLIPELRVNKVEEGRLANFPKHDTEKLLHVQDLLDRLQERIHRPPTAEQVREQEEWMELCRKAGVPGLMGSEDGEEDEERTNSPFGKGDGKGKTDGGGQNKYQQDAGMMGLRIAFGKPVTLGEIMRDVVAAKEREGETKEQKKKQESEKEKSGGS